MAWCDKCHAGSAKTPANPFQRCLQCGKGARVIMCDPFADNVASIHRRSTQSKGFRHKTKEELREETDRTMRSRGSMEGRI